MYSYLDINKKSSLEKQNIVLNIDISGCVTQVVQ